MKTLSEIEQEVIRHAETIGAPSSLFPTFGHTEDFARPHIEVDHRGYHWVVVERGMEQQRFTTQDLDDLLYRIFEAITFSLACNYELQNRDELKDCRRLIFKHQIDLLECLSNEWATKEEKDHARILQSHPFDDLSGVRARLTTEIGWDKACEKYPLPTT